MLKQTADSFVPPSNAQHPAYTMTPPKIDGEASTNEALEMISYVSLARKTPKESDLQKMLVEARNQNKANKITGSLLYRDGTYVQVFEGPRTATEKLYQKIQTDDRHHQVVTLFRRPTRKRYFKDWTMAYRTLTPGELKEAQDYAQTLQLETTEPDDPTREILNWIKSLVSDIDPQTA